jgi:hypothetical protein
LFLNLDNLRLLLFQSFSFIAFKKWILLIKK